jgi:hypothetical protein
MKIILIYIQTIYIKVLNSIYSNPHPQSYSFHSYKPKNLVDLLPMSPYSKISDSIESFISRVYNLHVKIIEKKFKQVMNNINFELIYISIMIYLMLKIIS